MKKLLCVLGTLLLVGCNHTVKPEEGSDKLFLLNTEPTACVYLYKINVDASFYSHDDAVAYLKNQIINTGKTGNVLWLESDEKQQNSWVMFGPEYKYSLVARVYNCQIIGVTKK